MRRERLLRAAEGTRMKSATPGRSMAANVTPIRTRRRKSTSPPRSAFQFLVILIGTNPLVWRRILVADDVSFWDLHVAIQDAMGWQDYHLHEFRVADGRTGRQDRVGIPDEAFPEDRPCLPGWKVRISEYFDWEAIANGSPARYVYDFGDDWHHLVILEDVVPRGARRYPRCVAGAQACPPEDCGGVHGFGEFLAAVTNPRHRRHQEMLDWVGGSYDPAAFDPARVVFDDPRRRWAKAFRTSTDA